MSMREGAELGMQPLDVAQSGAGLVGAGAAEHQEQSTKQRVTRCLLSVCFAHPGTCSKSQWRAALAYWRQPEGQGA